MLAYLDPSEDCHAKLRSFMFEILRTDATRWIPEFHVSVEDTWLRPTRQVLTKVSISVCSISSVSLADVDPMALGDTNLGKEGPSVIRKWLR